MNNNKRGMLRTIVVSTLLVVLLISLQARAAPTDDGLITIHAQPVSTTMDAYGQIVPIAIIKIRALTRGNLSQLTVVPGTKVSSNQVLAQLTGPLVQSLLIKRQQQLHRAQAQARSARKALRITRHKYAAQLTTQQRLDTAISNQVSAESSVHIAQAQLSQVQNWSVLRAPVAGTILSVKAINGEQTTPDQVVITLLPTNKLRLRATYYGAASNMINIGMSGQFKPADNNKPIPVKVIALAPNLSDDSGRVIELLPVTTSSSKAWISGAWGKIILNVKTKPMISVPTSALILDHGHWWVLLHTPDGNKPQQVIPGRSHGWSTTILSGLTTGQVIVIKNAYLRYHRGIASRYTPPD